MFNIQLIDTKHVYTLAIRTIQTTKESKDSKP